MAVNKVVYNGNTVMDISDSTISVENILKGFIGYDKAGNRIVGEATREGGGLPLGISAFDFGTYNKTSASTTTKFTVNHNLGVTPDVVIFYTPTNIATTYSMVCAMRGTIFNWRSGYNSYYFYHANSTSTVSISNNNNTNYGISNITADSFQVQSHSTSYYWRAGTYNYIAIKFA